MWYRAVTPVYRRSFVTMEGAFQWGGRYNTPGEFGALYLSKTRKDCAAEITRRSSHPPKYIVGKIRVKLGKVCDLTDPELLKKPRGESSEVIQPGSKRQSSANKVIIIPKRS
ncbi:MAG: RES domain-containing protein [Anaerolineales bacterium]